MKARGTLIVYSVVFAVALAAIADLIGLATIIGAFAAGLILATLAKGVISDDVYAALVVMVMLTTFAAPPWLKAI
jgi:Kef-type K+ transport system membrane component KefB